MKKPNAYVCIDASNFHYYLVKVGWRIDWKKFKNKCNFDVELTIDALDGMGDYDVFVLFSGDGDFVKLVKYLKGKKKKTVVIAPSDRLSDNLESAANQVIYLEDLQTEIMK